MKQFVVIGLGRFGSSVARTLVERDFDVLALDIDEAAVQSLAEDVTHAVQADATDENALSSLGLNNFDVAIVAIGSDIHANILATMILKEMGVRYIVAKALNPLHGKVLAKVGADKIVYPERDMGRRIALNLISSKVLDFIEFAPNYSIIEIKATKGMVGKTLTELQFRTRFGANVIALRAGERINISPSASDEIKDGDVLVVLGKNSSLDKLKQV